MKHVTSHASGHGMNYYAFVYQILLQLTKCTDFNNSKVAFVTKKYADWT